MQNLTPRQLDVVAQLARGLTESKAAAYLGMEPTTLYNHVSNVKLRLKCRTTFQLAFRLGCLMRETVEKEKP